MAGTEKQLELEHRQHQLEQNMEIMHNEFCALKKLMEKNNTALDEFISLAEGFKFGMKILCFIEQSAAFVTKLALAGGVIWAIWKFLVKETVARIR